MASAVVPFQDEPESEDQYPKPAIGELGSAWECQKILRRRVKDQNDPHLTRWQGRQCPKRPGHGFERSSLDLFSSLVVPNY